jgi:imidazole glycerol-phosphate synthase subunit HisH
MSADVVIVDYGMGNLLSVKRGLEAVGAQVSISSDGKDIIAAERLILPGVGAFGDGMNELRERALIEPIHEFVAQERPLLGICLGMQMLLERSDEFGEHMGLGCISGSVQRIPATENGVRVRKIPHIGWNGLKQNKAGASWNGTILQSVEQDQAFYFVHSHMAIPDNSNHLLAVCDYEGLDVSAVVGVNNVVGCQFHPEKSGPGGLAILKAFLQH